MKFEKAFVGGTIVEVHWKVLPGKLAAPPSTLPPPIPQPSLKGEVCSDYICILCFTVP